MKAIGVSLVASILLAECVSPLESCLARDEAVARLAPPALIASEDSAGDPRVCCRIAHAPGTSHETLHLRLPGAALQRAAAG